MLTSKVPVQVISSDLLSDDTVLLGETIMKKWKIPQGQHVTLKFGASRNHIKVVPVTKYSGLRIGSSLAKKLGIIHNSCLRLHYEPISSLLAIGPLISVLISRDHPDQPDKPFGSITLFCKELFEACQKYGAYVYFFTPDHISESGKLNNAWIYSKGWKQIPMPVADVVNNRLTSRKLENKPSVQHFLQEVKSKQGTVIFNEKFLDKHEVFDALGQDRGLSTYLPESHLLRSLTQLKTMCARYHSVFLKPVRGSLGKGIIRVTKGEGGSCYALHATPAGTRRVHHASVAKLYSAISGKLKTTRFQIQQGLQLIEIQRRPVDFRALVQKNKTGAWAITSIVARTAGTQHFVSNLARGGTLSPVPEAIAKSNLHQGTTKTEAASKLRQAALHIAQGIDEHIPAHFGELGIDLALDTSGKVWLLEVNSKPSKNDNTALATGKIRPSVRMMLQYARFVSGF